MATTYRVLEELTKEMEQAKERLEIIQDDYNRVQDRLHAIQDFANETKMTGQIRVVNSAGRDGSNTILTAFYKISGISYMLMVTEFISDEYICFMGHIIDNYEKEPVFSCDFYIDNFDDKQALFNELLGRYAKWRFDI